MTPDKQNTGKASKSGPPASRRRRWALRFIGVLLVVSALLAVVYLVVGSNYGMQRFVLPVVAQYADVEITAEHANLHIPDDVSAEGVVIKLLGKDDSLDAILNCKTLNIDLHGPRGVTFVADNCELYIMSWTFFQSQQKDDWIDHLADANVHFNNLTIHLPPVAELRSQSPAILCRKLILDKKGRSLDCQGGAVLKLPQGPHDWESLDQMEAGLNLTFDFSQHKPRIHGSATLMNRFTDVVASEFEEIRARAAIDMAPGGDGKVTLRVRGATSDIAEVAGNISRSGTTQKLSVEIVGKPLILKTRGPAAKVKIERWTSQFDVSWDNSDGPLQSNGSIDLPGCSIALRDAPNQFLPSLLAKGNWEAARNKGKYSWNVKAEAKQGDQTLFKLASAYGTNTATAKPVEVNLPEIDLPRLAPYLAPLGIAPPNGRVAARFMIKPTRGRNSSQQVDLNIKFKEVSGIAGIPKHHHADGVVLMKAKIQPWERLDLDSMIATANIKDQKEKAISSLDIRLLNKTSIPIGAARWIPQAPSIKLGIKARMNTPDEPPSAKQKQGIVVSGRATMELDTQTRLWIDVRGSRNRKTFLQASLNTQSDGKGNISHLELASLDIINVDTELAQLLHLPDLASVERLSVSGILRATSDGVYSFSGAVRSRGAGNIVSLPPWLRSSAALRLNGAVDMNKKNFTLDGFSFNGEFYDAEQDANKATLRMSLQNPLAFEGFSRDNWLPTKAQLQLAGDVSPGMLKRWSGDPDIVFKDSLKFSSAFHMDPLKDEKQVGRFVMQAAMGAAQIVNVDLAAQFREGAKLDELQIRTCTASCPPALSKLFHTDLPNWSSLAIVGNYAQDNFQIKATVAGLRRLGSLPSWTQVDGDIAIKGTYTPLHPITITTCDLNFMGLDPAKRTAGMKMSAKLTKPFLVNPRQPRQPATGLDSGFSVNIDAPGSFIARVTGKAEATKAAPLALRLDWLLRQVKDGVQHDITTTVDSGKDRICDLKATALCDAWLHPRKAEVAPFRIMHNDAMLKLFLADCNLPKWKEMRAVAKLTDRAQGPWLDVNIQVSDIHSIHHRFQGTANDISILASGNLDRGLTIVDLQKAVITATSTHPAFPKQPASLSLSVTNPVRIALKNGAIVKQNEAGQAKISGRIPELWLAKISGRKPLEIPSTLELAGTILASRDKMQIADLQLNITSDKVPVADCTAHIEGLRITHPINAQVKIRSAWHDSLAGLIAPLKNSTWESVEWSAKIQPSGKNRIEQNIVTTASFKGYKHAQMPVDTPSWNGSMNATLSVNPGKETLRVDAFNLKANAGSDGNANCRLLSPLTVNLKNWAKPIPALASSLEFNAGISRRLAARLRNHRINPGAKGRIHIKTTVNLSNLKNALHVILTPDLRTDKSRLAYGEISLDLGPAGELARAETKAFHIARPSWFDVFPEVRQATWDKATITWKLDQSGTSEHQLKGSVQVKDWQLTHPAYPAHLAQTTNARFAGTLKNLKTVNLSEFVIENTASNKTTQKRLATAKIELVRPASIEFAPKTRSCTMDLRMTGNSPAMPALILPDWKSGGNGKLAGSINIRGNAKQIIARVNLSCREKETTFLKLRSMVTGGWNMKVSDLSVQELKILPQKEIIAAADIPGTTWRELKLSAKLVHVAGLTRPHLLVNGNIAGLRGHEGLPTDVGVHSKFSIRFGSLHQLPMEIASLEATVGLESLKTKKALGNLNVAVSDGPVMFSGKFDEIPKGKFRFSGDIKPAVFGKRPALAAKKLKPITFRGDLRNADKRCSGALTLFYGDRAILDLAPAYNRALRMAKCRINLASPPIELTSAFVPTPYIPRYENVTVELELKSVPDKPLSDQGMLYIHAAATEMRDRIGLFEKGDLDFDAHAEFHRAGKETFFLDNCPIQVKWNDKMAIAGKLQASSLQKVWSVDLNKFTAELPVLMNMVNRFALPADRRCTGGRITGNLSVKSKDHGWIGNSIVQLKKATFTDAKDPNKHIVSPFDWRVTAASKASASGKSSLHLVSEGAGRKNRMNVRFEWDLARKNQYWPTGISVTGEYPDFTPFYQTFIPRRTWKQVIGRTKRMGKQPAVAAKPAPLNAGKVPWIAFLDKASKHIAKAEGAVDRITVGPVVIEDIGFRLSSGNGAINIESMSFEPNGGDVNAEGWIRKVSNGFEARAEVEVSKVPLAPYFDFLFPGEKQQVQGKLSADIQTKGKGRNIPELIIKATGAGNILIRPFKFYQLPMLKAEEDKWKIPKLEYLAFDRIRGKLVVADGWLKTSELQMTRSECRADLGCNIRVDGYRRMRGNFQLSNKHLAQVFLIHQPLRLFGLVPIAKSLPGYKTFAFPFELVNGAVNIIDEKAYQPFSKTQIGKFINRLFSPLDLFKSKPKKTDTSSRSRSNSN